MHAGKLMKETKLIYPRDFAWGAATAAYQIEGAWNTDGKGKSIWDTFAHTPGTISDGTNADVACDHYHLFKNDVRLMREMGIKHYRFSVSWPRVLPEGKVPANQKGLDFYDRLVDELLEAHIEPYLTLYHWDLPEALHDKGGWANRDVCKYFADYSALMVRKLGDRVKFWTTFNEPWVVANMGYLRGEMAPGLKDEKLSLQVIHNLLVAHGMGVQAIRGCQPNAKVGIVLLLFPTSPNTKSNEDKAFAEYIWNKESAWYLDALFKANYPEDVWNCLGNKVPDVEAGDMALISQQLDYLGVNFYFRFVVSQTDGRIIEIPGAEYTDMGWEVNASAFHQLLTQINSNYRLPPIYITENGAAYKDQLTEHGTVHDKERILYLDKHLTELHRAIQDGVDVRGYFVWSLMDNFEWAFGFSKRFGIVHVDYETQKRTCKDSGHWYSRVIQRNGLGEFDDQKSGLTDKEEAGNCARAASAGAKKF